jgi:hypothetical protein
LAACFAHCQGRYQRHWRLDWLLHWQCVGIGVDQLRDFILTSSLLGHGLKGALLCVADEVVLTYS